MSSQIAQIGDPVLRQIAQPVQSVKDPKIQTLIDQMVAALQNASGVGIAAPQLGVSLQLLVVASHPNSRYPHAPLMTPTPMVNPQLNCYGGAPMKGWEGCLSVPNVRGLVPRYPTVEVRYCDRYGNRQQQKLEGFVARIFQHEFDHLQGKVFTDRVDGPDDLFTEAEYLTRIAARQREQGQSS